MLPKCWWISKEDKYEHLWIPGSNYHQGRTRWIPGWLDYWRTWELLEEWRNWRKEQALPEERFFERNSQAFQAVQSNRSERKLQQGRTGSLLHDRWSGQWTPVCSGCQLGSKQRLNKKVTLVGSIIQNLVAWATTAKALACKCECFSFLKFFMKKSI